MKFRREMKFKALTLLTSWSNRLRTSIGDDLLEFLLLDGPRDEFFFLFRLQDGAWQKFSNFFFGFTRNEHYMRGNNHSAFLSYALNYIANTFNWLWNA